MIGFWKPWLKGNGNMVRVGAAGTDSFDKIELNLVHWNGDGRCFSVSVEVDEMGFVTVEHAQTHSREGFPDVTDVVRVQINGWDQDDLDVE